MSQSSKDDTTLGRRYALCVGIGTYTKLTNCNLRYAVVDAKAVAERLGDPQRGNFAVTLLTEPAQTTKQVLDGTLDKVLNAPELKAEDLVVIYLACHGNVYGKGNTFYFQPSDAEVEVDGMPKKPTVIDIYGLATALSEARVKNIIFLLDVCHSGGAGVVLEHLDLNLNPDTNLFIIGSARHDQTAIQSSTLGHGIFTSCLLQAFEQEPNRPDGWLTILDIHSFVSKVIKSEARKLSGQESPVQIQARSASVNPNLLFVKNPHYLPQSCEFHNEVKKLLELVQYEPVETVVPEVAPAGFYIAEIKSGFSIRRVGIIPYYNKIESLVSEDAEKIALFVKEQIEKEDLDEGLLVTALEVGKEVKNTIRNSGVRYLGVRTYGSVWKDLIDFKKYLQKLVDEYQASAPERRDDPPLAEVYIHLDAERRQYKVDTSVVDVVELKSTGEPRKDYELTWQGDLEKEVRHWLFDADPANSRLAVLADYGSGKSTFCEHMAARLAKDNLNAKEHERYGCRIPLLIPLRNFGKNPVDLEGYLVAYLKQYCRVDNPSFEALMKMAEAGLLLFILDGFDEMASRATTDTVRLNIELFESLANLPQNKVLLTTRPEYFMNLNQEKQVLQAYPCLYLQPFKEEQIDLYLQKRVPFLKLREGEQTKDWTYYRRQINEIHDLSDLVRRPVLLEMIIKTLPVLVAEGKAVSRPNLYQRYLEGELDRQLLKQRRDLQIDRRKRFEIMEQIAVELYRTDRAELTSKQILEISRGMLTPEQQEEMEGSLREIVTCSFLIRTSNTYCFSHQSFLEYLVACRLAKDIMDNKRETFGLSPMSWTILGFLCELEVGVIQRSPVAGNTINTSVSFDHKKLEDWFLADSKDRWMSSNVVSLLGRLLPYDTLCKLPLQEANLSNTSLFRVDLHKIDLSGADLSQADLRGANLRGTNLSGTNLRGADLRGADLSQADLRGADLRGADLRGADLSQADLRGADLSQADLRGAKLIHAYLSGAKLIQTDLRGAKLIHANLIYAQLIYAQLTQVDLREADLSGAKLTQVDLSGANLSGANLSGAQLTQVDLRGAELSGAKLIQTELIQTELSGAKLIQTELSGAKLIQTELSGAKLIQTELSGADLRKMYLKGADLKESIFEQSKLEDVMLEE